MISCDTNILLYAADTDCAEYQTASIFMNEMSERKDFVICDLVLVELYRLLRNARIFKNPMSAKEAAQYCRALCANPNWQILEYVLGSMKTVWDIAETQIKSEQIFDIRLGTVLKRHGVQTFATRNVKDFKLIGFKKLLNPID